jgi:hypothetical protein
MPHLGRKPEAENFCRAPQISLQTSQNHTPFSPKTFVSRRSQLEVMKIDCIEADIAGERMIYRLSQTIMDKRLCYAILTGLKR